MFAGIQLFSILRKIELFLGWIWETTVVTVLRQTGPLTDSSTSLLFAKTATVTWWMNILRMKHVSILRSHKQRESVNEWE